MHLMGKKKENVHVSHLCLPHTLMSALNSRQFI